MNIYYNCKIVIIEKSGLSVDSLLFLGVILKRRVYIKLSIHFIPGGRAGGVGSKYGCNDVGGALDLDLDDDDEYD